MTKQNGFGESHPPTMGSGAASGRSPLGLLLGLFSSITLGIVLMCLLFIYMTIGSAGLFYVAYDPGGIGWHLDTYMLRQHRLFELSEFEWFHTPVFNALIGLMCLNIVVATLRRIPFKVVNLGVWMIHTGIITLSLGSVWYFSTKVEGDTPVFRREIRISVPGAESVSLLALPGASATVEGPDGKHVFVVSETRPDWPILTGEHAGKQTFSVSVMARTPSATFIRQLLDRYPQFTEDVIPGRGRVKKLEEFEGRALVDEDLGMTLERAGQDRFWIKDSSALQIRKKGDGEWQQRRIRGLPRYNDYISDPLDVWEAGATDALEHPLNLPVATPTTGDALANADVRVVGYLRYAIEEQRFGEGETPNPMVDLTVIGGGGSTFDATLFALDPERDSALREHIRFVWESEESGLERWRTPWGRRVAFSLPGQADSTQFDVTNELLERGPDDFTPIGSSGYAFRIFALDDALPFAEGQVVWVARAIIRRPDGTEFERWIADAPGSTRDVPRADATDAGHGMVAPSPEIESRYLIERPETIVIAAGPEPVGVRLFHGGAWDEVTEHRVVIGEPVALETGQAIVITRMLDRASPLIKPRVIPPAQREKDLDTGRLLSLVRVAITESGKTHERWLPFHKYSFESRDAATPVLSPYQPTTITLSDGREIELMFSRLWDRLPAPVALEDFILTTRVGGFTGSTTSVRDWTSELSFMDGDVWTAPVQISTNDPRENAGFWYFQSYWEPPRAPSANDPGSAGLTFTGLGVGNRNGVQMQLLGCAIAVAGMIYAFYIKPIIKRRRQDQVHASLERREITS